MTAATNNRSQTYAALSDLTLRTIASRPMNEFDAAQAAG